MLSWWTIGRATGIGVVAGLAALILWPVYAAVQEAVLPPFLAALVVTAFCGASILWISAVDLATHSRGAQMRKVRAFDIVLGFLLAAPSSFQLYALLTDFRWE